MLALGALADPDLMRPGTVLAVPVLLGGLSLPLREYRLLVIACVLLGGLVVAARGLWVLSIGSVLIFLVVIAVSYEQTRRRDRLGVRRARPDQILLDLRERLRVQGEVPPLPAGWGMEVELRPADDAGLAGDFVVSRVHAVEAADGRHDLLDLALVDLSAGATRIELVLPVPDRAVPIMMAGGATEFTLHVPLASRPRCGSGAGRRAPTWTGSTASGCRRAPCSAPPPTRTGTTSTRPRGSPP